MRERMRERENERDREMLCGKRGFETDNTMKQTETKLNLKRG